jgi:hypothetical protein
VNSRSMILKILLTANSKFISLRVQIDVNSPLKKEMNVRTLEGTWITAKFKYERLGTFYFLCGVLGHRDKTCAKLFEVKEDDSF